jgi:(3R)-3-[(carboxylmethyl)amino]fatty acid synthase
MTTAAAVSVPVFGYREEVDPAFIERVLRPYKPSCRYLQSAVITASGDRDCPAQADGEFSIAESSYIESTGHFNAAEFVMCLNQLGYVMVAKAAESAGFGLYTQQFRDLPASAFAHKQLASVLILNVEASFRKQIDPRRFRGNISWRTVRTVKSLILLQGTASFSDDNGGRADGKALIGIVL